MSRELGAISLCHTLVRIFGYLMDLTHKKGDTDSTNILVGNDFDVLDMSSSFEDLAQDILSHARIKSTNIERTLIWLWGRTTNEPALAIWRHDDPILTRHRRGYSCWNGIRVLRDDDRWERRRRHVRVAHAILAVLVAWSTGSSRWRWELRPGRRRGLVRHRLYVVKYYCAFFRCKSDCATRAFVRCEESDEYETT